MSTPSTEYVVGLPDTQGGMCWLAGYSSDPERYYSPDFALRFESRDLAESAIREARKTHPAKERHYEIIPVYEMGKYKGRYNAQSPTFKRGDLVRKKSGSNWSGKVVGEYSTELTPEGYAVESSTETGSVQIYPAKALEFIVNIPKP